MNRAVGGQRETAGTRCPVGPRERGAGHGGDFEHNGHCGIQKCCKAQTQARKNEHRNLSRAFVPSAKQSGKIPSGVAVTL